MTKGTHHMTLIKNIGEAILYALLFVLGFFVLMIFATPVMVCEVFEDTLAHFPRRLAPAEKAAGCVGVVADTGTPRRSSQNGVEI